MKNTDCTNEVAVSKSGGFLTITLDPSEGSTELGQALLLADTLSAWPGLGCWGERRPLGAKTGII